MTVAPHSVEAEESVLGSILIHPDTLFEVAPFLHADDFFIVRNQWVWEAILRLHHRNEHIDNVTVAEELDNQERLEDVGGSAYIAYLINHTPASIYTETYGRIVERAAIRRRMLDAASEIARLAGAESDDIDSVLDRAESALFEVNARRDRRQQTTLDKAVADYFDRAEQLYLGQRVEGGLTTGYNDVDRVIGGLRNSELIIFAGRPGMGKTSWALGVALHVARQKKRVAIFSLEMGIETLTGRLLALETGLNAMKLQTERLDERQWALFVEGVDTLSPLPIVIDDSPTLTPFQLRAACRRLHRQSGLDLVIVDYLQLMHAPGQENHLQEVSFISRQLKQLARELNRPVLAAAQLSRAVEQRADKRPQLADLRGSGTIEQDADIVMFIYRDEVYHDNTSVPNQTEIITAKHRNGPTGISHLYFHHSPMRFDNIHHMERIDFNSLTNFPDDYLDRIQK